MTGLSTIPLRRTVTVVLVAILAVPTIFVVVASFGGSREIAFPPQSFTLHWYSQVIGDSQTWSTLSHSLVAAVVASLVSAVAGVLPPSA